MGREIISAAMRSIAGAAQCYTKQQKLQLRSVPDSKADVTKVARHTTIVKLEYRVAMAV
jgi:hypothetical protein